MTRAIALSSAQLLMVSKPPTLMIEALNLRFGGTIPCRMLIILISGALMNWQVILILHHSSCNLSASLCLIMSLLGCEFNGLEYETDPPGACSATHLKETTTAQ